VLTDMPGAEARARIKPLMDDIWKRLSFGMGLKNQQRVDSPVFERDEWEMPVAAKLKQLAHDQLGTIGSGNHYVDLFTDEQDRVWVGVHFGSRGPRPQARLALPAGRWRRGPHARAAAGAEARRGAVRRLLAAMRLAGEYAYAGRDWVCDEVVRLMGSRVTEDVHNHHNFAWLEEHHGEQVWVVRKGATPAFPGQRGFVGGSMGDDAVILEGVESPLSAASWYSTVHGAGRAMSRTPRAGKVNRKTGEVLTPGSVSQDMMRDWVRERGVELRGAGTTSPPTATSACPRC
jgi:tRNA-splicing ligase RtcB